MIRFTALSLVLVPFAASAFSLEWPIDCKLKENCFIQNFVDHDSGPAAKDFACNANTYDGHEGTDIRLRSLQAMRNGVNVKAAADGKVIGVRDGMADASIRSAGANAVSGKECGNGVHLQHADGYRTQYCHMKKGSITVKTGQEVKAGDVLGQVGLSGGTEFPHLHLSVWKADAKLDPFTASTVDTPCSAALPAANLWAKPVPYHPTALLNDGITSSIPEKEKMRDVPEAAAMLKADIPALLYWADVMNVRQNDTVTLRITGPDGKVFSERTAKIEKPMALYFVYIGKKNGTGLVPGVYQATFSLVRNGAVLVTGDKKAQVM